MNNKVYTAIAAFNQLIETQPELAEEIANELNWHPPYGEDSLSVKLKNHLILCAMHKAHKEWNLIGLCPMTKEMLTVTIRKDEGSNEAFKFHPRLIWFEGGTFVEDVNFDVAPYWSNEVDEEANNSISDFPEFGDEEKNILQRLIDAHSFQISENCDVSQHFFCSEEDAEAFAKKLSENPYVDFVILHDNDSNTLWSS